MKNCWASCRSTAAWGRCGADCSLGTITIRGGQSLTSIASTLEKGHQKWYPSALSPADKHKTAKMSLPALPSPDEVPVGSCLSRSCFKIRKCVTLTYCLGIFQSVAFVLDLRESGFAC